MTSRRSIQDSPRKRSFAPCALAVAALAAVTLPSSAAAAPGSGSGAWVWALVAVGAIVLVFTLMRLRGRSPHGITEIADGRELLIARGRRVTEALTDLADVVAERDDEGATRQHQRALDVVASARARIGRAPGPRVQGKAHEELDEAEWLIGVLRARLDGFVEPVEYRRGMPTTCFFNGEHGLATVAVDLEGIELQRVPVRACAACAVGLVRGERPRVGYVALGGRSLPWPAAPRWCGSYAWAVKDLKHLHYDGAPMFGEPERATGRRRQTVAERARGVRARVLPIAPEVLEDDSAEEYAEELEAFADEAPEETGAEVREPSGAGSAFAAMEADDADEIESAPVAARDTPAE